MDVDWAHATEFVLPWVSAGIALFAALASTAVAIAAFRSSRQATRIAGESLARAMERARQGERAGFRQAVISEVDQRAIEDPGLYPHGLREHAITIEDSVTALEIVEWLQAAFTFTRANSDPVMRRLINEALRYTVTDRTARWVKDAGAFELRPFAETALH